MWKFRGRGRAIAIFRANKSRFVGFNDKLNQLEIKSMLIRFFPYVLG